MFLSKSPKSPYYHLCFDIDGKRKTITTKKRTLSEAEKFQIAFKNKLLIRPADLTQTNNFKRIPTLSAFRDDYFEYATPIFSKCHINSMKTAFKFLLAFCGNIKIDKIEVRHIDKFVSLHFARTKRGALLYYRILKAAFNKAIAWKYITENVFEYVTLQRILKPFPAFITEDDLLIILSNTKHEYLRDLFTCAFYTGLRLGELVNMRWSWVNLFQNQITVIITDQFAPKGKRERIVPLCEKVKEILTKRILPNQINSDDLVFYRINGKILYKEAVSKQFKKIVRKSHLSEKIHFHSLRHSFASLLAQKGISLRIIQELMGHNDISTTQVYAHLLPNNLHDAVRIFNQVLEKHN